MCEYSGCTLIAIVGVVFSPMNCDRNIILTYSANLPNKTGETLMFSAPKAPPPLDPTLYS